MKKLFDGIGEVTFMRNARSKNLRITVRPFEGVKVTLPGTLSYQAAISFVDAKSDWIKNSLGRMHEIEKKSMVFDHHSDFRTKYHQLHMQAHKAPSFSISKKNGILLFCYPEQLEVASKAVQDRIKAALTWLLRKEAQSYLPFRVKFLAEKNGFSYNQVYVKNLKSRWGSCSYVNNINLNIHLMRLPDHLIDYVILHELAHTVHKNHGKGFWQCLNAISPQAMGYRREMKQYSTGF
jgi:predicted metal-dependent hydrolase